MKLHLSALRNVMHRSAPKVGGSDVLRFMNPNRDWVIGLAVAVTVLIIGVLYIAYDFHRQFGAPAQTVTAEAQRGLYQDKEVVRYADFYEERERLFGELRKTRAYVPVTVENVTPEKVEEVPSGAGEVTLE